MTTLLLAGHADFSLHPIFHESSVASQNLTVQMPVTYVINAQERLIRTRCVGNVVVSEVINHFRTLEHDPNCPDHLDVFLDVSETTSLPFTPEITSVAQEINRVTKRVRFNFCAVVATGDALFGMMRMFAVLAGAYFTEIRVFRAASEAEAWLAAQRSLVK